MSKIQWEYDLVEKPFCEQLKAMGWEWIEGDKDVPDFTERQNFRGLCSVEKELAQLNQLKSGLMNDLLAGRVRVPEGIVGAG